MGKSIYKYALYKIWEMIRAERFVSYLDKDSALVYQCVRDNITLRICENPELTDDILKNPDKYISFELLLGKKKAIKYGFIKGDEDGKNSNE